MQYNLKYSIMENKFIYFIGFLFSSSILFAQIPRALSIPKVSQKALVQQRVGFTDITINYSSPAVRDRDVWNSRVIPKNGTPFPWRAGANENTVITFTDDVLVEGSFLEAGSYGLHMIPNNKDVIIIFSRNHTSWGSFFYKESEDVLRITVKQEKIPHREWLTYDFEIREQDYVVVALKWGEYKIPFKIEVDKNTTFNHIRNQLRSDAAFTLEGWVNAAQYCLDNEINYEEGLIWINKALKSKKDFNWLLVKAELLNRMKEEEQLAKTKEVALSHGTEMDFLTYLIKVSRTSNDALDLSKDLAENLIKNKPKTWEANYALSIYFSSILEDKNKHKVYSKKAKRLANEVQKKRMERDLKRIKN